MYLGPWQQSSGANCKVENCVVGDPVLRDIDTSL